MRVALTGGAYQARSVIASAQQCINLFGEALPQTEGEPTRFAYYPTPGLAPLHVLSGGGEVRGLYGASNGALYAVAGTIFYRIDNPSPGVITETYLATLSTGAGPVSMADNSLTLMMVDGSQFGLAVDLVSNAVVTLSGATPGFYGADHVDYLDTFFVLNKKGTQQFYVSNSLAATFDPIDFASKSAAQDHLVAAIPGRGQLWLLGERSSEVWTDSGSPDFPFSKLPGILIEHGCSRVHSIAKTDGSVYFLSQDKQGSLIVLRASGYEATRVSTHALEAVFATYPSNVDAVGYCFQQQGHVFYVLTFPAADVTWVFDEAEQQWHQWAWMDQAGMLHRHRSNCFAQAFDTLIVGDWQNGELYILDLTAPTDNGAPIKRVRSFPHLINDGKRASYVQFTADVECGGAGSDGATLSLEWSDDRGATYGAPVVQAMSGMLTQPKWSRLGLARDRVFRLFWTAPVHTALQGAWIDIEMHET